MQLSNAQINFFWAEIHNEAQGGIRPACLDSALDSLRQAPHNVIEEWCGDRPVVSAEDHQSIFDFKNSIENMRRQHGGACLLIWLLHEAGAVNPESDR